MAAYKDEARGTWYVSFHYNDWTGKNKRKLKRGFRTRKEALEYEQKFLLQQATNLDMRFEDFYKLYEEDLKPKLKLNTWRTSSIISVLKILCVLSACSLKNCFAISSLLALGTIPPSTSSAVIS